MFCLSCFCYAFVCVCLYVPCGHMLRKGWPLGSRLWCLTVSLSLSHWYPGSGVVLDCIDSWSLQSYLLWYEIRILAGGCCWANRHLAAFSLPGCVQWQWRKLAFGLCNAPSMFSRLMQLVCPGLIWKIVLLYLDDIICHSKTLKEQLTNLELLLFKRLWQANLKLNPTKCCLFQREVTFLGHTVSDHGIGTLPVNIDKVKNWLTPQTAKEARSFISLASYYQS